MAFVVVLGLFAVLLVPSASAAVHRRATVPKVPKGNLVYDSNRTGTYEIFTMPADGSTSTQLTDDPAWDSWWAKLSPDRTTILFYRTPADPDAPRT